MGQTIPHSKTGITEKLVLRHASTQCCCHCAVVGKTLFLYFSHTICVSLRGAMSSSSVNVIKYNCTVTGALFVGNNTC